MTVWAMHANKYLLNTDFQMDQVILTWTGYHEFGTDTIFAHGLSFTPLIKVVWSLTEDFATTYGVGDGPVSTSPSAPFSPMLSLAYADATNVYCAFGMPGAVAGAYIRVYGFAPADVSADSLPTANAADNFILNTDYNYSKLFLSGKTAASSTPGSGETITHNLGYIPQVEVWYVKGSNIYAPSYVASLDGSPLYESYEATTASLIVRRDPYLSGSEYFYYRIYMDEL